MAINTIINYAPEYVEKLEQITGNLTGYFLHEDVTVEEIQEVMQNPICCVFLINNLRELKSHLDK